MHEQTKKKDGLGYSQKANYEYTNRDDVRMPLLHINYVCNPSYTYHDTDLFFHKIDSRGYLTYYTTIYQTKQEKKVCM